MSRTRSESPGPMTLHNARGSTIVMNPARDLTVECRQYSGMKGDMKHLLIGIAMTIAVSSPVSAQVPYARQQQYPDPNSYRFVAPTPEDAYRAHLINRWELEQLSGPTPQALQGPSPNGNTGFGTGN